MEVAVNCSTERDGLLQWRRSNGKVVPLVEAEASIDFKSTMSVFAVSGEDARSLSLRIPRADQSTEGSYECWFTSSDVTDGQPIGAPYSFNLFIKSSRFFYILDVSFWQ